MDKPHWLARGLLALRDRLRAFRPAADSRYDQLLVKRALRGRLSARLQRDVGADDG
jgi:hypothetical protein